MGHAIPRPRSVRSSVLMAAAVATVLVASACGDSGGEPATDAGTDEPVSLTVWTYWDGNNAEVFQSLVDQYTADNPQVNIDVVTVPGADLLTKIQSAATTDTLPDVSIGDLVWVPRIAETGRAVDLTDLVPEDTLGDIYDSMLSFGALDGGQLSVPVSANDLALMYNRQLWQEAGLDPDQPPATWEDLQAASAQIRERTGKPGFELFTQPGDNGEGVTWNFQVNLWQAGGEFLTEDNTAAAFNSDAGRQALQWWVDLVGADDSPLGPWGEFEKGNAGSAQEGSWMVGVWSAEKPFDFGVAAIPHPSDGEPATNLGGEQAVVLSDDEAVQRAAADFLTWFVAPEQSLAWSQQTGFLPVRESVAESAEYTEFIEANAPAMMPFVEALPTARARPSTPLYPQVSLAFAKQVEQAVYGRKSVEQALADAEAEVNEILAGS